MRRAAVALLLAAGLWLALCAERAGTPEGADDAGRETAAASGSGSASGSAPDADGEAGADGASPPAGADARVLRTHRLRVVNWAPDPALLYGSAGAREVLLDTVPGADSARLELRIRADSVVLRATSPYGTLRGRTVVRFRRGEPGRWVIPTGASG